MLKYRGHRLIRAGFVGAILMVLVTLIGLQPERLLSLASTVRYQAVFSEAGGLTSGNAVTVSGLKVGTVDDIALRHGTVVVTFNVDATVPLGSQTAAHIRTRTLLGERVLTLDSAGSSTLRPREVIPVTRTSSPYSLAEAVSDLTTNAAGADTQTLNQSLDALSATLDQISPQLGPTFDGLTRLSQSLNERNESLGSLLKSAATVTGVLGQRSNQLNTLILDANDLVSVLNDRRLAIANLLVNTRTVAQQLSALVADNEKQLAPTLQRLNDVAAMLEKNRDNLAKALPGLVQFERTQGESVASGYYYHAFVANLSAGQFLQPFLDYAFGFRRGTGAGQPPDNAGPRAEFPFPVNGIPIQRGPQGGQP
ncbi:MCE family protein [Mycobacterium sp. AZCC_0083]|uniref:MCE family protein n=1 Tax=Mycobacterium sp. AZCC_0083 TaxID=2735882 RepID=UPI001614367F|nr:MCE family protein [Mycobacterium sp. AZCC_0083]MBB5165330.1 phospholipid/cholesterol/gamma-HCH transport system substrate-binding protein [Mycobacterium sp. AZCC_0083]